MRLALTAFAAAAALVADPALAAEGDAARMAKELADPAQQAEVAALAATMAAVLLEMNVAPLARAAAEIEGGDPDAVDPDLTVRDLAGPEAADAPGELAARVPQMIGAMATLAAAFEQMLPQLRAMGEQMAGAVGDAAE
jgi:hypothetical protein